MKKCFLLFLTVLCTSCSSIQESKKTTVYDYIDIQDRLIKWSDLFYQKEDYYLVYIYSLTCGHCKNIKQNVISCAMNSNNAFYFVEYSKEIPISISINETIGTTNVNDVYILGTPTLIEINNLTLTKNIAGESEIKNFLNQL